MNRLFDKGEMQDIYGKSYLCIHYLVNKGVGDTLTIPDIRKNVNVLTVMNKQMTQ